MNIEDKIKEAKALLRDNGYIVRKLTAQQEKDCEECGRMSDEGQEMDCLECACSVCIVQ